MMVSIDEQLGEIEEKAQMLTSLSRITMALLGDEAYTKKAAAADLIKFMNSQMKTMPSISDNIEESC
ncbi:hypothetical protein [Actinomadura geliboluensis]|uniref:hypothetical protein n=1 Tax=Actinomadura geliboluensis TaxID=882440 RepID=UPI00262313C3|nr:hypothetical protein [Actinomadura geliboluensis]